MLKVQNLRLLHEENLNIVLLIASCEEKKNRAFIGRMNICYL